MKKILSEKYCTGCSACSVICPTHAIAMVENDEGFLFPNIDSNLCIDCKQCIKSCPVIASLKKKSENGSDKKSLTLDGRLYAARNFDNDVLSQSSSGGLFHAVASSILQTGGIVYGVIFDSNFIPIYIRTQKIREINLMCSSKYIEAVLSSNILNELLNDIKDGRRILFSGTPCQTAGIISICKNNKISIDNAYFVDFFTCSGVPSRRLWKQKLTEHFSIHKIESVNFRSKKLGWRLFSLEFIFQRYRLQRKNIQFPLCDWGRIFLSTSHSCRRSCKFCCFLTKDRQADFSIGDLWNSWYIPHKWQDDKGVSLVMINTVKAGKLLDKVSQFAELIELDEKAGDWAGLDRENNYIENIEERKRFWSFFMEHGFTKTVQRYCPLHIKDYMKFGFIRPILIRTGLIKYIDKIVYKT